MDKFCGKKLGFTCQMGARNFCLATQRALGDLFINAALHGVKCGNGNQEFHRALSFQNSQIFIAKGTQ